MDLIKELYYLFFPKMRFAHLLFNTIMQSTGIAIVAIIHIRNGVKNCPTSPDKFTWGYFIDKNWIRVSGVLLTMFITLVYMEEIIHYLAEYIPNEMARLTPLVLGICNDLIFIAIQMFAKWANENVLKKIKGWLGLINKK